jgi:hypothetical protein
VEEPSTASNSDLDAPKREVRSDPINGHRQRGAALLLSASNESHVHYSTGAIVTLAVLLFGDHLLTLQGLGGDEGGSDP